MTYREVRAWAFCSREELTSVSSVMKFLASRRSCREVRRDTDPLMVPMRLRSKLLG